MKSQLRPAAAAACVYVEDNRPCREPAAGELRGHYYKEWNNGRPWPFCERHLRPEMHPPDLRDKLYRWPLRA